jgi:hypothetical protein
MVRAVAGRRALQVGLLLAGLLALGFLCGERAQAADGVPAPERVKSVRMTEPAQTTEPARATEPVRKRVAEPVADAATAADTTVGATATATAGADAAEPVVRTARDVAGPVVDGVSGVLGGTPSRVLPEAPEGPAVPTLPAVPVVPAPGGNADPDTGAKPPSPSPSSPPSPLGARADEARKVAGVRGESAYGTGTVRLGYAYTAGGSVLGVDSFGGSNEAHRAVGHGPFPAPGDPGRTLGGQSAGDGGSTRHGDPCAASLVSRAPVRLLQGGGAPQAPATIRDRHRDIPEFPG